MSVKYTQKTVLEELESLCNKQKRLPEGEAKDKLIGDISLISEFLLKVGITEKKINDLLTHYDLLND